MGLFPAYRYMLPCCSLAWRDARASLQQLQVLGLNLWHADTGTSPVVPAGTLCNPTRLDCALSMARLVNCLRSWTTQSKLWQHRTVISRIKLPMCRWAACWKAVCCFGCRKLWCVMHPTCVCLLCAAISSARDAFLGAGYSCSKVQ